MEIIDLFVEAYCQDIEQEWLNGNETKRREIEAALKVAIELISKI